MEVSTAVAPKLLSSHGEQLMAIAFSHACARHRWFEAVAGLNPSNAQIAALLRNYDAHASVLRRLLLKAATLMPETAVGFILENVRNEYGNGDNKNRHQLQLIDLAHAAGVSSEEFHRARIEEGVRDYIDQVIPFYYPHKTELNKKMYRPAVAAGAITATEVMALEEFRAMHKAFARRGLGKHIWFDHLTVEAEHTGESVALAVHFIENFDGLEAVVYGLTGVLQATVRLYDGLYEALTRTQA
jgi:hypothetical protein